MDLQSECLNKTSFALCQSENAWRRQMRRVCDLPEQISFPVLWKCEALSVYNPTHAMCVVKGAGKRRRRRDIEPYNDRHN